MPLKYNVIFKLYETGEKIIYMTKFINILSQYTIDTLTLHDNLIKCKYYPPYVLHAKASEEIINNAKVFLNKCEDAIYQFNDIQVIREAKMNNLCF